MIWVRRAGEGCGSLVNSSLNSFMTEFNGQKYGNQVENGIKRWSRPPMLIEFKVANFRSFRACQTLSMVASSLSEHTDTNTFDPKLAGFSRFLRTSVIYGPNAAGKTNLLRALQFMQSLVINSATAKPGSAPPYTPFLFAKSSRAAPSQFQITFVQEGVRYEYGLWIS